MVSADFFILISSWLSALSPSLVTCVFVFNVTYSLAVYLIQALKEGYEEEGNRGRKRWTLGSQK